MLGLALVAVMSGCGKSPSPLSQPAADDSPVVAGGEPAGTTGAAAIDPCKLVSKLEAETLAGTPLDEPRPVRETCTYNGPVTGPTAQVEIFVGDGAKKFLDIDRTLDHQFTSLPGAGDEAYLEDGVAFVRKGGTWVSVRLVRLNDSAENRKPLEDLIRKVATRI